MWSFFVCKWLIFKLFVRYHCVKKRFDPFYFQKNAYLCTFQIYYIVNARWADVSCRNHQGEMLAF